MRLSKEKNLELLEGVRRQMVRNPDVTIFKLQELLSKQYNHAFDKNFIGKLKNKVHRERTHRVNKTIGYELAHLEDTINVITEILWEIIDSPQTAVREKISAIRELRSARSMLFEAMLNAGVFERQLGNLKIEKKLSPEEEAEMDKLLASVFRTVGGLEKSQEIDKMHPPL